MRRLWIERIAIAIAALASIATSPRRWVVDATFPPSVPDQARSVTVEASHEPYVWIHMDGGERRLQATDRGAAPGDPPASPAWPGQARYLVPAGARLVRIELRERCTGGGCSGECEPPASAYVRVASLAAVGVWNAEDRSGPVTTVLDGAGRPPSYTVTVEATRLPVALEVEGAPGHLAPTVRPGQVGPTSTFHLDWRASNAQAAPVTVTWTVRAAIQGECAGGAGCPVPPGETVRIVSVEKDDLERRLR